jgi:hypothetical protein
MEALFALAVANPAAAAAIAWALLSIANGAIRSLPGTRGPFARSILAVLDRASLIAQHHAPGSLKLPLASSWRNGVHKGPPAALLLALSAMGLSACADSELALVSLTTFALGVVTGGAAVVYRWRAAGLLVFLVFCGCQLGPRGQAAAVTTLTLRTLDASCSAFLDGSIRDLPAFVDRAVAECNLTPAPRACYDAKVASRERAVAACRAYGTARVAGAQINLDALGADARAALTAIGVVP